MRELLDPPRSVECSSQEQGQVEDENTLSLFGDQEIDRLYTIHSNQELEAGVRSLVYSLDVYYRAFDYALQHLSSNYTRCVIKGFKDRMIKDAIDAIQRRQNSNDAN